MRQPALLALEDGSLFYGESIGSEGQAVGEVIFSTAMSGYQEILTNPAHAGQIVTMTYPHIGSSGTNREDEESSRVHAAGLVIRELAPLASNWRSTLPLDEYLAKHGIVAIHDMDTRRLIRLLREKGTQKACIVTGAHPDVDAALAAARSFAGLEAMDLASKVSTSAPYEWSEGLWSVTGGLSGEAANAENLPLHVVAYDFGIRRNLLRMLVEHGCRISVVPARTPAADVLQHGTNGIFLSDGPGDPAACDYAIDAIRTLLDSGLPIYATGLGHQLLALAAGGRTRKMKIGNHGSNHPVQELATGKVMITSQSHDFAVDEDSLPANLRVTHRSLFDGSIQGLAHADRPAFSFQGYPGSSPAPHSMSGQFRQFVERMKK